MSDGGYLFLGILCLPGMAGLLTGQLVNLFLYPAMGRPCVHDHDSDKSMDL